MNKYNMKKQIKETSFWKPEKISSTRVIRGSPLFDFPGSKRSNPYKQNNKSNMFMTGFIPKTKYISPIYAQPKKVPIPSHMGINPKPVHPINMNTNVPKKDMNWFQAKSKFPKLNPFGDADHDGVINMLDCKPFDKNSQGNKKTIFERMRAKNEKENKEKVELLKEASNLKTGTRAQAREIKKETKKEGEKLRNYTQKYLDDNTSENTKTESPSISPGVVKETNVSVGDGQVQVQKTDQEITTTQSRDKTKQGGFNANIKSSIKNLSENKDMANLQELLVEEKDPSTRKVIERQLKNLANIEIAKIKAEESVKTKEIESLTRKEEALKKIEGIKTKAQIRAIENISREKNIKNRELKAMTEEQKRLTRERDREYQRGFLAAKGNKVVKVKKALYTPAKTFIDRYEKRQEKYYPKEIPLPTMTSGYMGTNRLKEIEIELKENPKKYGYGDSLTKGNSWQPKQDKVGINVIFDVPVKSKFQRFKEKVFGPKITPIAVGEKVVKGKSRATGKEYNYLGPIVRTEKYLTPEEMKTGESIKTTKENKLKYEPTVYKGSTKELQGKMTGAYRLKSENYPYKFDKYKNIIKKEKPQPYAVKILEDVKREDQILEDRKRNIIDKYIAKKELESKNPSTINVFPIKTQKGDKEMLPIRLEEAKEKYPLTVADEMRGAKARKITKISEEEYNTPMTAYEYVEKDKTKKEREIKEERQQQQEQKKVEMDKMKEERERRKEDIQRKQEERAIEVAAMKE